MASPGGSQGHQVVAAEEVFGLDFWSLLDCDVLVRDKHLIEARDPYRLEFGVSFDKAESSTLRLRG